MSEDKKDRASSEADEAALRAIDLGGVAVFNWNLVTGVFVVHGQWDRLLGAPLPADADQLQQFLELVHIEDRDRVAKISEEARADGESSPSFEVTFRLVRPDGELR